MRDTFLIARSKSNINYCIVLTPLSWKHRRKKKASLVKVPNKPKRLDFKIFHIFIILIGLSLVDAFMLSCRLLNSF